MRLYRSSIFILTCFSCVGFYSTQARAATANYAPERLELAQVNSKETTEQGVLDLGSQGTDVQQLQTQLQQLGYYSDVVNGNYGLTTETAVAKFQKAKGLKRVDGIADIATKRSLRRVLALQKSNPVLSTTINPTTTTTTIPTSDNSNSALREVLWWSILSLGTLGSVGAILFSLRFFDPNKQQKQPKTAARKALSPNQLDAIAPALQELTRTTNYQENTAQVSTSETANPSTMMPVEATSRLAKLNIVDELIQDLRSPDPSKRQKAIWDLGQQGDSRAVQPLVNLLIDANSQQRNLILAALSEINISTLKPINKALAISMQDESPQVRQNAIRDLTRVYDMMAQMSQMLSHALDDPDAEVQATARYALTQMNRMRNVEKPTLIQHKQDSPKT